MVIVDPRNLPAKFGQNRVSNSWHIIVVVVIVAVDVVVLVVAVVHVIAVVHVVDVDPGNLLKIVLVNSLDIADNDIEFPVVVVVV